MKLNFKVRLNPYTIIAIITAVLTALHVDPASLTSWHVLWECIKDLLSNPFLIATTIVTVFGVIHDPTTKGLSDSEKALNYDKPQ